MRCLKLGPNQEPRVNMLSSEEIGPRNMRTIKCLNTESFSRHFPCFAGNTNQISTLSGCAQRPFRCRENLVSNIMKPTHKWLSIAMALLVLTAIGCGKEISGKEFEEQWNAPKIHSAQAWYYLGHSKGKHYFAESWPGKRRVYKVPTHEVTVRIEGDLPLTRKKSKWIVLKQGMLSFPHTGS